MFTLKSQLHEAGVGRQSDDRALVRFSSPSLHHLVRYRFYHPVQDGLPGAAPPPNGEPEEVCR